MKRKKMNMVVVAEPLTAAEKKQVMTQLTKGLVTLPSHTHLVRLYEKYGLFQPIE